MCLGEGVPATAAPRGSSRAARGRRHAGPLARLRLAIPQTQASLLRRDPAARGQTLPATAAATACCRIAEGTQAVATFTAKATGVAAGLFVGTAVFARVDASVRVEWAVREGGAVTPGAVLGRAMGPARSLLVAERVALNFMQRAGGVATATARMVAALAGTGATLLDTRKTAPGLRLPDKWAVAAGGGANHRMGLFDMVMIKDNHIAGAGGIAPAVAAAEGYMRRRGCVREMEVETSSLDEVRQVVAILDGQPDTLVTRVMLDNMTKRLPGAWRRPGAGRGTASMHRGHGKTAQRRGWWVPGGPSSPPRPGSGPGRRGSYLGIRNPGPGLAGCGNCEPQAHALEPWHLDRASQMELWT